MTMGRIISSARVGDSYPMSAHTAPHLISPPLSSGCMCVTLKHAHMTRAKERKRGGKAERGEASQKVETIGRGAGVGNGCASKAVCCVGKRERGERMEGEGKVCVCVCGWRGEERRLNS